MFQVLSAMGSNQGQQCCPILSVCFSRKLEISDLNKGTNMNNEFLSESLPEGIGLEVSPQSSDTLPPPRTQGTEYLHRN